MEMKRCTAVILLMLSVEALVAGRLSAAGEEAARPWKCCDQSWCTKSFPPTCHCEDKVKKCDKTCRRCEKADGSNGASSGYVCRDTYSKPGPPCPKSAVGGGGGGEGEQARPWKCCDLPRCTRSSPPTCTCLDKVNKCAKNCQRCDKDAASSRFVCNDSFFGSPGPKCSKSVAFAAAGRRAR